MILVYQSNSIFSVKHMLSYTFLLMRSSSNFYNAVAREYENYCKASHVNDFLEEEINLVQKYKPTSILELGVGDGRFAREYVKRNPNISYTGIDNSEGMLMRAKDSGAALVLEDFTTYVNLAVQGNKRFDCIIAPYTAIHHIKTSEQLPLFENMKQITGTIIINCVTKEEEKKIFSDGNETEITFVLPSGNEVKTVIHRLHETIREDVQKKSKYGDRENLIWERQK